MQKVNKVILSSSNGSSKNGDTLDSQLWVSASFQFFTGGSGDSGTFKIQASNDVSAAGYSPGATLPPVTNWTDIPNQSASIASGGAALLTVNVCAYRWMRAVWTSSGGTDAVTVQVMAIYP